MPTKKTTSTKSASTKKAAPTAAEKPAPAKKAATKSTTTAKSASAKTASTKTTSKKAAPKKAAPKNAASKDTAQVSPDEVTLVKATQKAAPAKKLVTEDVSLATKETKKPRAAKTTTTVAARETPAGVPFIQLDALREELLLLAKRNGHAERSVDDVKAATLVYTRDRWATYETAALTERAVRVRGFTLPKLDDDTRVEFAVKASFDEADAALWLNNRGRNYAAVWKNAH